MSSSCETRCGRQKYQRGKAGVDDEATGPAAGAAELPPEGASDTMSPGGNVKYQCFRAQVPARFERVGTCARKY